MAITEYLNTHHVFTRAQFNQTFPASSTDQNLLARALRSGAVERVRSGVYVSTSGPYSAHKPDPFDVAVAVAPDAVFCFLSALELHGALHNIVRTTQFYTSHQIPAFVYDSHAYQPRLRSMRPLDTKITPTITGKSYAVTNKEQTIIDCLAHVDLAGGPDNLLHSLAGITYLDVNKLSSITSSRNTRAKLGWVLDTKQDEWGISPDILHSLVTQIQGGPYYFWSSRPPKDSHWVNRWRLYLPHPEQEMATWLNQ